MLRKLVYGILAGSLVLFGQGCSKNSVSTSTDQSAILGLVGSNTDLTSSSVAADSSAMLPKVAVDTVYLWWRQITHYGRIIGWGTMQPVDSAHAYPTITVTLTDTLAGTLHIIGRNIGDTILSQVNKPFVEVATRNLLFEKRGPDNASWRGWYLAGVSGIELVSVPTVTVRIDSVKVASGSTNKTITAANILSIEMRPNTLGFAQGDSVNITVFTGDATDSVFIHVHAHMGASYVHVRKRLTNNGNGSYSGYWKIPIDLPYGHWHFVADVLKGNVLSSNVTTDYDSRQWGIVYRVGVAL